MLAKQLGLFDLKACQGLWFSSCPAFSNLQGYVAFPFHCELFPRLLCFFIGRKVCTGRKRTSDAGAASTTSTTRTACANAGARATVKRRKPISTAG